MRHLSVPAQPAGYSGTPLPKKLGIKPGHQVAFVHAPGGFAAAPGALPEAFRQIGPRVYPAGTLWIAWPKQASRVATDVTGDVVRAIGLAEGMVDVKVCAIDAVWSGLKFVYRLADRR